MVNAFSNPTVRVNDVTWSIVPNSVEVVAGDGETKVRAASAGGNSIETVHTSNAESKIGVVKFSVYPTPENERRLREIKAQPGQNVVELVESFSDGSNASETLRHASLTNDPTKGKNADGVIALEWMGDPTIL